MKDNLLAGPYHIRPESIDPHHLTVSLLNEGLKSGVLNPAGFEGIQAQLMTLLSEAITRYTRGESSSVRTETAQNILQSLLYSIDAGLMELPSLEQSMEALQGTRLAEIHARGQEAIAARLKRARQLLREARETRLPVYLSAYNDTIDQGFDGIFEGYDIRFDAHNTAAASIDYPLLADDMSWTGVIYIERYLERLKLENRLCSLYPPGEIESLLKSCGRVYRMDVSELMVNVCELVLKNALCSVLVGRGADDLSITPADCELLAGRLRRLDEGQIPELLRRGMRIVLLQLGVDDPASREYFISFADAFYSQFVSAFRENALTGLFVIQGDTLSPGRYYLEEGEKMSDERLRSLIDRLRECRDGEEKADLIGSEVRSVEDLAEVFGSFSLYGDEYTAVFDRMGDYELAALLSGLLEEAPFTGEPAWSSDDWYQSGGEPGWREELIRYLENGDTERYKRLTRLAGEIRYI